MIGRDGETAFHQDPKAYGMEWQVRDTELSLFSEVKGPQYPFQCTMPSPLSEKRRARFAAMASRRGATPRLSV